MLLSPEALIDGMMRTLRDEVLPAVGGGYARGQLYCVLDVLNNLRDRVEAKAAHLETDATAAQEALEAVVAILRAAGHGAEAERLQAACEAAPTDPPSERAAALRGLVGAAIVAAERLEGARAGEAQNAIRGYLVPQVVRDIATLKPSMLAEISKG